MQGRPLAFGIFAAFCVIVSTTDAGGVTDVPPPDIPAPTPQIESRVRSIATGKGFLFFPSTPPFKSFRIGVGVSYDSIDPQVVYGYNVRVPQITVDARYGLGKGWSMKGHLNTVWVANELLLGGSYGYRAEPFSIEASIDAGLYLGQLGSFKFDANMLSPEYKPELALGYEFGDVALSLRASLIFMGPVRARVGDVWGGLDNAKVFAGHSEMLLVENALRSGAVWYFGLGVLTTRAYYQVWLLFPDSPALYTYARAVAGYEF
ncbi:MAG TPA: hypothetical protein VHC69_00240 [Polyangiaceae bacterium]|nr:hypothetical protein [Polyangiaceae bacterium]